MQLNPFFSDLKDDYLFSEISRRVGAYKKSFPDKAVIRLGIGDVTLPLAKSVVAAIHAAADDMGSAETFKGYGDYEGYEFLRAAIAEYYKGKGVSLSVDEIFVGDGAKSDLGNITELFGGDAVAAIPNPVYPAYLDVNVMSGRKVVYIDGCEENGFLPMPDESLRADVIYLCSPNNPTGAVYSHAQLKEWVDFAISHGSVILFDSAYEAYVRDQALPTSIYEVPGAKSCAVEICSLSKTAGFTGMRCGYTVFTKELLVQGTSLGKLWLRRQSTKFNGLSYVTQRAAAAVFTQSGMAEVREGIDYYMENARIIRESLRSMGLWLTGGENAPYIWLKCPGGMKSWEYFDFLLKNANVVGTPGAGFGSRGEGFFRLTAFGNRGNVVEAMDRISNLRDGR